MLYDDLTDDDVAGRLLEIANNVRRYNPTARATILAEAAKRLTTKDAALERFKERVRDKAITEADRRGWCGEFDQIIQDLGMKGRYGNYSVITERYYFDNYNDKIREKLETRCIARDRDHAVHLVTNQMRRTYGGEVTVVEVRDLDGRTGAYTGVIVDTAPINEGE